ncbi:MAG: type II toxin-antitoxin system RelE/ParE family toxin [Microthrixaceae bacterium]
MTVRVVFTPEAEDHLDDLYRYLADAATPDVAADYVDRIITYCEELAAFPHRGLARLARSHLDHR